MPCKLLILLAPQVGLEPTTLRLTAECSAIELLRSDWQTTAFIKEVQTSVFMRVALILPLVLVRLWSDPLYARNRQIDTFQVGGTGVIQEIGSTTTGFE